VRVTRRIRFRRIPPDTQQRIVEMWQGRGTDCRDGCGLINCFPIRRHGCCISPKPLKERAIRITRLSAQVQVSGLIGVGMRQLTSCQMM
jgi:hypothetical protein